MLRTWCPILAAYNGYRVCLYIYIYMHIHDLTLNPKYGAFAKVGYHLAGLPKIRVVACLDLYWGSPTHGKYHVGLIYIYIYVHLFLSLSLSLSVQESVEKKMGTPCGYELFICMFDPCCARILWQHDTSVIFRGITGKREICEL